MLKVLLLDEVDADRANVAMALMQAGHVAAVALDASGAQDKLHQVEFDWLLCRRVAKGGPVDRFLKAVCDEGVHADVLKLLLLTDTPPEDLDDWPLAAVFVAAPTLAPEAIVARLERPQTGQKNHGALPLPEPKLAGPLMIGSSSVIVRVSQLLARVARSDSTVLITGESGTGKELAAQSIHLQSGRASAAMIPLNCGAIPGELLESELFGHTRGAFTGAAGNRKGRLALAEGGTLFLDEIGEMPLGLQVKLLRVLQEQEYTPLGSEKAVKADVRIIAATNQNLEKLIEEKLFREDLFYRLNVIPITLPPLRERPEDVPELLSYFLTQFRARFESPVEGFAEETVAALCAYPWPGNVRELRNIVERLVILGDGLVITSDDLPEKIRQYVGAEPLGSLAPSEVVLPEAGLSFYEAVEEFEKSLILQALRRTDWNKNKAAALLNMNRTTLVEKIKKRDISRS